MHGVGTRSAVADDRGQSLIGELQEIMEGRIDACGPQASSPPSANSSPRSNVGRKRPKRKRKSKPASLTTFTRNSPRRPTRTMRNNPSPNSPIDMYGNKAPPVPTQLPPKPTRPPLAERQCWRIAPLGFSGPGCLARVPEVVPDHRQRPPWRTI